MSSVQETHRSIGPLKITLAAGTYDGGIASYEMRLYPDSVGGPADDDDENDHDVTSSTRRLPANKLHVVFASPVHGGSVRSLTVAGTATNASGGSSGSGGLLLSTGYDEMLKTHDFGKRLTSSGEVRTPADFGTPYCSAFAPPHPGIASTGIDSGSSGSAMTSTHCLVGFGAAAASAVDGAAGGSIEVTGGKLVIYKKREWSIQHVLAGHEGGVGAVAVHPTGKMALSGGLQDGKLKLWDLERGRLAYSSSITRRAPTASVGGKSSYSSIDCIVWNHPIGDYYAFCHGSHITVRQVETGKDMLDVDLPAKVNQICLLQGPEGLFVAAACNDGSLPLLAVDDDGGNNDDTEERRAIMAIEPVDGPVAGGERFKCIQAIAGYYVATANSAGVVSVMHLQGAVNMITNPTTTTSDDDREEDAADEPESDESEDEDDEDEAELAVEIIDSVQLGSGSRITCLTAWATPLADTAPKKKLPLDEVEKSVDPIPATQDSSRPNHNSSNTKDAKSRTTQEVVMDPDYIRRARDLISKAKKIQKRKSEKKQKIPPKAKAQRIK